MKELVTISERLVAAYDQSSRGLTSTTGMNKFSYARLCLEKDRTNFKCSHITNPETCIRIPTVISTAHRAEKEPTNLAEGSKYTIGAWASRVRVREPEELSLLENSITVRNAGH